MSHLLSNNLGSQEQIRIPFLSNYNTNCKLGLANNIALLFDQLYYGDVMA